MMLLIAAAFTNNFGRDRRPTRAPTSSRLRVSLA